MNIKLKPPCCAIRTDTNQVVYVRFVSRYFGKKGLFACVRRTNGVIFIPYKLLKPM